MRTPNAWIAVLFVVPFTLLVGAWSVVSAASFHMPKQVGWADGDAAGFRRLCGAFPPAAALCEMT